MRRKMKLIRKVSEFTINEICLTSLPEHELEEMLHHPAITSVEVREYTPRRRSMKPRPEEILGAKISEIDSERVFYPDLSKRHQIRFNIDIKIAKVTIFSTPIGHGKIKRLGLTPLEKATAKEKTVESVRRMDPNGTDTTRGRVEIEPQKEKRKVDSYTIVKGENGKIV
jgi:hypothetical protein